MLGTRELSPLYWQSSFRFSEIISCHEHVSVDWSKISLPQIITAESIVTSATITLLARRVYLKGTFVEMYIDIRSRQFLVGVCTGCDGRLLPN